MNQVTYWLRASPRPGLEHTAVRWQEDHQSREARDARVRDLLGEGYTVQVGWRVAGEDHAGVATESEERP